MGLAPRRGEFWSAAGGAGRITSKPRPVLILQTDSIPTQDYVTVAPVTSQDLRNPVPVRIPVDPTRETGLEKRSFVMADKITTITRSSLSARIGEISQQDMREVERGILLFLDIAR